MALASVSDHLERNGLGINNSTTSFRPMPLALPMATEETVSAVVYDSQANLSGFQCSVTMRQNSYELMIMAQDLERGEEFTTTYEMPQTALEHLSKEEQDGVYTKIVQLLCFKSQGGKKAKRRLVVNGRVALDGTASKGDDLSRGLELASQPLILDGNPMVVTLYGAYRILVVLVRDRIKHTEAEFSFPSVALSYLAKLQRKSLAKQKKESSSPSAPTDSGSPGTLGAIGSLGPPLGTPSLGPLGMVGSGGGLSPEPSLSPLPSQQSGSPPGPRNLPAVSLAPVNTGASGSFNATADPSSRGGREGLRRQQKIDANDEAAAALMFIRDRIIVQSYGDSESGSLKQSCSPPAASAPVGSLGTSLLHAEPTSELKKAIAHAVSRAGERLFKASGESKLSAVQNLLMMGAPPDHPSRHHAMTPLMNACIHNQPDVVKALLDAGANPNGSDQHGTRPLMLAARAGYTESVWLLLYAGAKIDSKDRDGATALHLARHHSHIDTAHTIETWLCRGSSSFTDLPFFDDEPDGGAPAEVLRTDSETGAGGGVAGVGGGGGGGSEESLASNTFVENAAGTRGSSAEGGSQISQTQYQWALTTGKILQAMEAEDRQSAWEEMSPDERDVYNRVMQGRFLILAKQLAKMTPEEQAKYWSEMPEDVRAQYETVMAENETGQVDQQVLGAQVCEIDLADQKSYLERHLQLQGQEHPSRPGTPVDFDEERSEDFSGDFSGGDLTFRGDANSRNKRKKNKMRASDDDPFGSDDDFESSTDDLSGSFQFNLAPPASPRLETIESVDEAGP